MRNVAVSSMTSTPRWGPKDALAYEVGKTYRLLNGVKGGAFLEYHDIPRTFVVSGIDCDGFAWSTSVTYNTKAGDWCVGSPEDLESGFIVLVDD